MATTPTQRGRNEPELRPIIVKKIIAEAHHAPHGGAWKVAYADFVTAMMAFFMLMWLLSITDEQKRKGLAEYFTPTPMEMKKDSSGSDGIMSGDSVLADDPRPHKASQIGSMAVTLPNPAAATQGEMEQRARDRARFEQLREALNDKMDRTPELKQLKTHVRFSETPEGLRIDLVDEADFSMFRIGTDKLVPQALNLVREVATVIGAVPNEVIVRGHTDGLAYARGQTMNNWLLSTARAEATRSALGSAGIVPDRFARIEGVADREPFVPTNLYDARNRRMSITLSWSKAKDGAPPRLAANTARRPVPAKS